MKIRSDSVGQTEEMAARFVEEVNPLLGEALVVGLYGDLGSGKTAFVQGAARAFGIKQKVTSPTFVIMKSFKLQASRFKFFIHIDAYRLEKESELTHLGWQEIAADPGNIIFLEWPEKVQGILPQAIKKIRFAFIDETTREIEID